MLRITLQGLSERIMRSTSKVGEEATIKRFMTQLSVINFYLIRIRIDKINVICIKFKKVFCDSLKIRLMRKYFFNYIS